MAQATLQAARASRFDLNVGIAFNARSAVRSDVRESVLACHRGMRDALSSLLERIVRFRGHDPAVCCRRELTGLVADLPLFELMPLIKMNRRSAIIDVRHGSGVSRLWCADGELVDASSGNLQGSSAAYRVLALDEGELCVDFSPVNRPRLIRDGMQTIVMNAAQRKDECRALTTWLGGLERIWCAAPSATGTLDDIETVTLEALVHEQQLGQVLARNRVGDLETLQAVARLAQRGDIHSPAASSPPSPPDPSFDEATTCNTPIPSGTWVKKHRGPLMTASALALVLASAAVYPQAFDPSEQSPAGASALPPSQSPEGYHDDATSAYRIRVTVDPTDAALWLDRRRIATGYLDIDLQRDGQTHELIVAARDRQSQTYLFQDVPPPSVIVLGPARARQLQETHRNDLARNLPDGLTFRSEQ